MSNSKRKSLMCELNILTQPISVDDDIENEDLEKCYIIIKELLNKQYLEASELTLIASFRYALGRQTMNNSKLNIKNSSLSMDGIGEFVKWYRKFYGESK